MDRSFGGTVDQTGSGAEQVYHRRICRLSVYADFSGLLRRLSFLHEQGHLLEKLSFVRFLQCSRIYGGDVFFPLGDMGNHHDFDDIGRSL